MSKTETDGNGAAAATKAAPTRDALAATLPDGDVLVRRIAGPDGVHPTFGQVKHGRLYTVEFPLAVRLTTEVGAEFETVYADDRSRIDAAANKEQAAANKNKTGGNKNKTGGNNK